MRIVTFTPYGNLSRESGLIYLVANYLRSLFPGLAQVRCNGMLAVCNRDGDNNWKRDIHSCFRCMGEQKKLARWAGLRKISLSRYLLPEDVEDTKRWILSVPADRLLTASFRDISLFELCHGSFRARFGVPEPDLKNKNHEQMLRRFYLAAARVSLATNRFNRIYRPGMSLIAGGDDLITNSFIKQSHEQGADPVVFRLDFSERGIRIFHPQGDEVLSCDLLLEDIYLMRADYATWPNELMKIIEEILIFLGLYDVQLSLPIAQ